LPLFASPKIKKGYIMNKGRVIFAALFLAVLVAPPAMALQCNYLEIFMEGKVKIRSGPGQTVCSEGLAYWKGDKFILESLHLYGPDCTIWFVIPDPRDPAHLSQKNAIYRIRQSYCSMKGGEITVKYIQFDKNAFEFDLVRGDYPSTRGKVTVREKLKNP